MLYWHRASLQGIESVTSGGPPFQVPASSDEINGEIVAELSGTPVSYNYSRDQGYPETVG